VRIQARLCVADNPDVEHNAWAAPTAHAPQSGIAPCLYPAADTPLRVAQDYIQVLEHVSEARRREVLALKAAKRRLEVEAGRAREAAARAPAHGALFCGRESSTLPAKLRAIVEDNRVLKEKARKFRERCAASAEAVERLQREKGELVKDLQAARADLKRCTMSADEVRALEVRVRCTCRSAQGLFVAANVGCSMAQIWLALWPIVNS
jgi:hypothetical protein